jgi:hypothetical protein
MLFIALVFPFFSFAQTLDWWRNLVNWDGTTYYWKYLTISPKYFGPNALSIPQINNGSIDSVSSLGVTGNFHFSKGDNTQNLVLYGNYAPKNTRISVDAQFVPYERFKMSHAKKEERKVYYLNYYDKSTVGDVIINTTLQLFQKWRDHLQLALRVGMRLPSGGGQGAARYADVPGYWIDAGAAIPWQKGEWKWVSMIGFYVWQTNKDDRFRQDDALLCGTGLEWNKGNLRLQTNIAAYFGYQENGDDPIVYRISAEKRKSRITWILRFQQGLHDFSYTSVEAGAKFHVGK